MKKPLLFLTAFIFTCHLVNSQNFTWVRGENTAGAITGTYGVMGVPSPLNDPGGRHGCATWIDNAGNLWLFGGEGYSTASSISWLNDLWKYDINTNEWTWIRGSNGPDATGNYGTLQVPASTNEPGAREFAVTWTDNQGNFWMFGGDGFASTSTFGRLGDLWKYNPTTNQWTWMKGFNTVDMNGVYGTLNTPAPGNMPGARYAGAKWVGGSNGDLWLFGGRGFAATGGNSHLNDLWKYDLTTNNWTWMGGTSLGSQNGVYGTINVPSTANRPGGIEFPASWVGSNGQFYMFSGRGYVGSGTPGYTADMWRYNPTTGEWTWLKGPNLVNQNGNYGALGVASAATQPGGRYATASWTDPAGNFWLFGGFGYGSIGSGGSLNDLFKYNPTTNQFTWMKGASNTYSNGIYGTMGTANAANIPGARFFNDYWGALNGNLWLFGGEGLDISSSSNDYLNDLWKFGLPCNPDSVNANPGNIICSGNSVTLTANNQYPATVMWYSSPTSTNSIGSGSTLVTGGLAAVSGSSVYSYYSEANSCNINPRTAISITVNPLPQLSITGSTAVCAGSTLNLVASGANTYTWTNGPATAANMVTPTVNTIYTITGTSIDNCTNNTNFSVTVNALPSITASASQTNVCRNETITLTANGANTYTWSTGSNASVTNVVTPTIFGAYSYSLSGTDSNGCKNTAFVAISIFMCDLAGVNENNLSGIKINLYPNPSHSGFTISIEKETFNAELKIVNLLGQVIYKEALEGRQTNINQHFAKGLYLVEISREGQKLGTAKLLIE